ncbi:MAG: class II aldolase/adducin family protein [Candidatus Accumulibacter sp.]|jgi:L-fuculose-phosphate aldolase|nr:class II aldolase/adducin family protein [Accumulibacter sp.]
MPELRRRLIDTARRMESRGLSAGTSGNLSVRAECDGRRGYLITPTGMRYTDLSPGDVVFMPLPDDAPAPSPVDAPQNARAPSSEWRFHHDIYAHRPEAGAVLHAHSPFAVSLACLRRDIPPFHYMIARFGGDSVRCARYATFGTQALSDAALLALEGRNACLLANHGQIVFGRDLEHAFDLGVELETLCEQYWRACQVGEPILLGAEEMRTVLEKFGAYGQPA